ncbi:MAG: YqgE/AlgH family protein [Flavobacteriales bacterium]|jgi:putative transcriptional regulator|nr:YqgE/AlgH family protein [Flavobacteriales bacterium]MBK6891644.1 YqgE/AlgH family protein [Flavobacteriales bacterium]MBK7247570.1 YqgE/AlgH family protein [Flavobacteriales bacterium]MBK7286511.1 YqgE/AlgH family protein [Flavobacteriales bacterium]MBK9596933.1 YqgE/AlgH family protein [Flavobacteriales bacterium]
MSTDPLELDPPNPLPPAPGTLLVSGPYLADPYFRRSVVLLCMHDDEGSFGLVLNRPIDMAVSDLMEDMPTVPSSVGIGGPVQSGNLFYLHTLGPRIEGSMKVVDDIHMGGDYDQLKAMLSAAPKLAKHVRFFVGYSGWGADQLNTEIEQRSWLIHPADKRVVMNSRTENLWANTLRTMGPAYAPLANFPEDPSLN